VNYYPRRIILGTKTQFFHVSGSVCRVIFRSFHPRKTLMARSDERSRLEDGFPEKKLATLWKDEV
jgi:hypothetical protein